MSQNTHKLKDRIISFITAVVMAITILPLQPITAYAQEQDTAVCTHHTHNEECGYVQAVEEVPCVHTHDESCGFAAATGEVLCECTDTDENGATVHAENCGYIPAAAEVPCIHTHDENCGYAPAVAGTPCTWTAESCAECSPVDEAAEGETSAEEIPADESAEGETPAEEIPADETAEDDLICICGTDDETFHAANCPLYTAVESPACFCAEKCTEDNVNIWCDICGAQGADACLADSAVSQTTYAGGSIWVGGVELTGNAPYLAAGANAAQAEQPTSGGYAHWDAANNILTLNNYTYSGTGHNWGAGMNYIYNFAAIYANDATKDFKINLVGKNSLSNTSSTNTSEQGYSHGIVANYCGVSIYGDGSLEVSANYGIRITGLYKLNITGGTIKLLPNPNDTSYLCYGIYAYLSDITIGGGANVSITQGSSSSDEMVIGINSRGNSSNKRQLSITGNATLTISGSGATAGDAYGIRLYDSNLTIGENAKVSIENKASSGKSSYGIYANNGSTLTVNGNAQLTAKAGNGSTTSGKGYGSYGIYNDSTGVITISGTATVTAGSAEGAGSQAIYTDGALTVSGTPTVTATSGTSTEAGRDNGGIYAQGNISLEGGKVVAIGGNSKSNSFGIYTAEQLILGTATVNATGGSAAEGMSISVRADKGVNVKPEGKSISVLTGENESADTLVGGAPFSTDTTLNMGDTAEKQFLSYPDTHTHTMKYVYEDSTGHWQECSDTNCPDTYKGKTATSPHQYDTNDKCVCGRDKHTHSWQYTADESANTITASCTAAECPNTSGGSVIITVDDSEYNGSAYEADVENTLTTGATYTVSYTAKSGSALTSDKAVNAGEYTATLAVEGKSVSDDFEIKAKQITEDMVSISANGLVYNGAEHEPGVTVDGCTLNTDYTVEYSNNINPTTETSKAKVTVTGKGNYAGTVEKTFEISKAEVTADMFSLTYPDNLVYNGSAKTVKATLKDGFTGVGDVLVKYYDENGELVQQAVNAGNYTVKLSVSEGDYYNATQEPIYPTEGGVSWSFEIAKATYDTSKVKWDYTAPFTFDKNTHTVALTGLPQGVEASYTDNSKKAVGSYTAKATLSYDSANYNALEAITPLEWAIEWNPAENTDYVISSTGTPNSDGWYNKKIEIKSEKGYQISTAKDGTYGTELALTEDTADGSVTFWLKDTETGSVSNEKTVTYKLDATAPTGTVTVEENSWTEFLSDITFGIFFNKTVDVKVNATDTTSGVKSVEYIESSTALTQEEVKQIANWTAIGADNKVSVTAKDAEKFVYYIRITDNADNVTIISTDGVTFDLTAPVINGITSGETYYTTQRFTVEESNLESVTVNGNQSIAVAVKGNVDKVYNVTATDKAGNSTTVTVTMKPISTLTENIEDLTEENVTADNSAALAAAEAALAAVDTKYAFDEEKAEIAAAQEKIDTLQQIIEDTANEVKALEDAVAGYDKDTVKSTDESDVDQLIADITAKLADTNLTAEQKTALAAALEDAKELADKIDADKAVLEEAFSSVPTVDKNNVTADDADDLAEAKDKLEDIVDDDNYTEDQQQAVQEQIEKIEELEKVIEETKTAVDDATSKPDYEAVTEDTVTSDDKQVIEENIAEIYQLLNNQNVSEGQKEELRAAKDAAQALLDKIAEDKAAKDNAIGAQQAVTEENVTADDAQNLADAKSTLETLKADDNYTATEKAEIQEEIDRITALEEVIEETKEAVDKAVAEEGYADKTEADITSAEKDEIEANVKAIEDLLGTDNLTEEQRKALEDTKTEAEKLLNEINENSETLENSLNAEKDTTADNYHPSDKEDLEEAVENLKAVTDESNKNYTAEEKQTAQAEIDRLNGIIEDINEVNNVNKAVNDAIEEIENVENKTTIPDNETIVDAVIEVANDYEKLSNRQKELLGSMVKEDIRMITETITAYKIIHGAGGKWTKGSSSTLGFTANGLFKLFKEVRVDRNVLVKDTDYTAMSGSTVVTLSKSYLDTLSVGKHKLEVVYEVLGEEHIADCEFTIKAKPAPTDNVPKTGDTTNTVGWMAIMLSSMAALAVVLKKKKEYEDR